MLPYCFLLLFLADGLAKLCFPARELTELLFIMPFLWKMNYKFQTALKNRILDYRVADFFYCVLFEKDILVEDLELTVRRKVKLGSIYLGVFA